jgi:hypothetical protein
MVHLRPWAAELLSHCHQRSQCSQDSNRAGLATNHTLDALRIATGAYAAPRPKFSHLNLLHRSSKSVIFAVFASHQVFTHHGIHSIYMMLCAPSSNDSNEPSTANDSEVFQVETLNSDTFIISQRGGVSLLSGKVNCSVPFSKQFGSTNSLPN